MTETTQEKPLQKVIRWIINLGVLLIVGAAVFLAWDRFFNRATPRNIPLETQPPQTISASGAATQPEAVQADFVVDLPPYEVAASPGVAGIHRLVTVDTQIPTRPRVDVITYTVQTGDSLFSIADTFSLKAETLLWGNFETLEDNPHLLRPGQTLNILPTNGTYYQWQDGDSLATVADFFGVEPQTILEYPGNRFDLTETSIENPGVAAGTWLIVPDGKRAIKDWGPPAITRDNPASARYYGEGHCGAVYTGAVGTGTFVWPAVLHSVSGYTYDANVHPAIDVGGSLGDSIYAVDSGVVVYSGWSNYGYGNLIVIDHGNGWQSAYAHLNDVYAYCGQSVFQGAVIGPMGSTGNSTGPHLHFELIFNGAKVNPLNFISP